MTTQEIIDYLAEYSHDMPGVSLTYFIGPVNSYIRIGIISVEHTSYKHINIYNFDKETIDIALLSLIKNVPSKNPVWKPKVIK
jgi:hypothetical protein